MPPRAQDQASRRVTVFVPPQRRNHAGLDLWIPSPYTALGQPGPRIFDVDVDVNVDMPQPVDFDVNNAPVPAQVLRVPRSPPRRVLVLPPVYVDGDDDDDDNDDNDENGVLQPPAARLGPSWLRAPRWLLLSFAFLFTIIMAALALRWFHIIKHQRLSPSSEPGRRRDEAGSSAGVLQLALGVMDTTVFWATLVQSMLSMSAAHHTPPLTTPADVFLDGGSDQGGQAWDEAEAAIVSYPHGPPPEWWRCDMLHDLQDLRDNACSLALAHLYPNYPHKQPEEGKEPESESESSYAAADLGVQQLEDLCHEARRAMWRSSVDEKRGRGGGGGGGTVWKTKSNHGRLLGSLRRLGWPAPFLSTYLGGGSGGGGGGAFVQRLLKREPNGDEGEGYEEGMDSRDEEPFGYLNTTTATLLALGGGQDDTTTTTTRSSLDWQRQLLMSISSIALGFNHTLNLTAASSYRVHQAQDMAAELVSVYDTITPLDAELLRRLEVWKAGADTATHPLPEARSERTWQATGSQPIAKGWLPDWVDIRDTWLFGDSSSAKTKARDKDEGPSSESGRRRSEKVLSLMRGFITQLGEAAPWQDALVRQLEQIEQITDVLAETQRRLIEGVGSLISRLDDPGVAALFRTDDSAAASAAAHRFLFGDDASLPSSSSSSPSSLSVTGALHQRLGDARAALDNLVWQMEVVRWQAHERLHATPGDPGAYKRVYEQARKSMYRQPKRNSGGLPDVSQEWMERLNAAGSRCGYVVQGLVMDPWEVMT